MTFIDELDPWCVEIYHICKYELPTSRLYVSYRLTKRHTDRHTDTTKIIYDAASWVVKYRKRHESLGLLCCKETRDKETNRLAIVHTWLVVHLSYTTHMLNLKCIRQSLNPEIFLGLYPWAPVREGAIPSCFHQHSVGIPIVSILYEITTGINEHRAPKIVVLMVPVHLPCSKMWSYSQNSV